MIRLSLLTGPVPVDFTDIYPGFKLVLRRLDSAVMAEAKEAALSVLREARKGLEALADYGFDGEDAHGVRLNPRDVDQMVRAGHIVGSVEVAIRAIVSWEGICADPEGEAIAPINRLTLSILLRDPAVERRLLREIDLASRLLVTEGNVSGPSPAGSSAIRPGMTGDQHIAPAANRSARRAQAATEAKAGDTVPRSSTRRKPSKASPSGGSSADPVSG